MIKNILDSIASENSTNKKMAILSNHTTNDVLQRVLYNAYSKRVKFYIKQIPPYTTTTDAFISLDTAIDYLQELSARKFTGDAASAYLGGILSQLHPDDAIVIERIIGKDLKIGMTGNINKVFPKLIEETPYMGAQSFNIKLVKDLFKSGSCYADVKMDGRYNNAIIRAGEVELESRGGEPVILTNSRLYEELKHFPDCVLNGELTMGNGIDRYTANGMIASIIDILKKQGTDRSFEETALKIKAFELENKCTFQEALDNIIYTVWDTISIDEYFNQSSKVPYSTRWNNLLNILATTNSTAIVPVEKVEVHSYQEAMNFFQLCLNRGLEGAIIKSKTGEWKDGKPKWQIKMKLELDLDLEIIGFNLGTPGTKNENVISSLICQSSDGLLVTNPGGMDEKTMKYVTENQSFLMNTIVNIKCSGISKDSVGNYSLLHPRMGSQKFRDDKTVADSLDQIIVNENMCKGLN